MAEGSAPRNALTALPQTDVRRKSGARQLCRKVFERIQVARMTAFRTDTPDILAFGRLSSLSTEAAPTLPGLRQERFPT